MNTWKVILATLVIFGTGVITGGMLVTYSDSVQRHQRRQLLAEVQRLAPRTNNNAARDLRVPLPPNLILRKDFLERLDRELKLNARQHERIEKLIGEGQERIKELSKKIEPQVHEELAETREKIRAELTTEQRPLFTEIFKRKPVPARAPTTTNPAALATATNSAAATSIAK